jgi:flagellar motor switch protein FliN/FliY
MADPTTPDSAGAGDPTQATPPADAAADTSDTGQAAADAALAGLDDQAAIDELLKQATFEDPTAGQDAAAVSFDSPAAGGDAGMGGMPDVAAAVGAAPFELPNLQQVMQDAQVSSIDLLRDVELNVKIELGRSRMLVEDVLKLAEGSVVELEKLAGDPVDVFVNDRLVARGEVLVLNDNFCVRVNEIVATLRDEGA